MRYGFYIQMSSCPGVVETGRDFGMHLNSAPALLGREAKDIAKRSWHDEDGDDEYVPPVLYIKSCEQTLKFVYRGGEGSAPAAINRFVDFLSSGTFSYYDEYYQSSGGDVRFVSGPSYVDLYRTGERDVAVFSVKVKVNSPRKDVSELRVAAGMRKETEASQP